MIYDWYKVFNLQEFLDSGLVSKEFQVALQGTEGIKNILITLGNQVSVVFEDQILPIGFEDKNPYARSPYAVYRDEADDIWLGIEAE